MIYSYFLENKSGLKVAFIRNTEVVFTHNKDDARDFGRLAGAFSSLYSLKVISIKNDYRKYIKYNAPYYKQEVFQVGPKGYAHCDVILEQRDADSNLLWFVARYNGEEFFCVKMYGTWGRAYNTDLYCDINQKEYHEKRANNF